MLKEARFEQVYIVCGYTDMRRSIDGLAGIVKQNFGLEPCSGSLFLFCGKRRDRMKALLWERSEERRVGKECRSRGSPYH